MAEEPAHANRNERLLSVPDNGQSDYVRMLEGRLAALEKRVLHMENVNQEHNDAIKKEENNEAPGCNNEIDVEDITQSEPNHPPFPPTVAEVRNVHYNQAAHHAFTEKSIPAIELVWTFDWETDHWAKVEAFKRTLREVGPGQAIELVTANYTKPFEPEIGLEFSQIRILSSPLWWFLMSVVSNRDDVQDRMAVFDRPWTAPIFYHDTVRSALVAMEKRQTLISADESTDQQLKEKTLLEELRLYVSLMDERIIPFSSAFRTKTAKDNSEVRFEDLWHLFVPGETIYHAKAKSNPPAADSRDLRSKMPDQELWRVYTRYEREKRFFVKGYCIDYDSESYVCVKRTFCINKYEGKRSVNSLSVYPLRFASNADRIMKDATEVGRWSLKARDSKLLAHTGWAFVPEKDGRALIHVSSDVVIDSEEAFNSHPTWKPNCKLPSISLTGHREKEEERSTDIWWYWAEDQRIKETDHDFAFWTEAKAIWEIKKDYCYNQDTFLSGLLKSESSKSTLREEDLHLLSNRLFGYSLQDRRFVVVHVQNLRLIDESRVNLKNLIISPSHAAILRALVESHFTRKGIDDAAGIQTTSQDIVQNKGRGLFILLHGVPGVGKTSTAETMASEFRKPLLPITCGDLGLDPATVETSLKQVFRLAQLWDCILLLDEADVFLSERVPSDLNRNALVSVFLRVLDYYSGVLFLTTSRVGTIDEAFKSRIHLSLYYPYLDLEQTKAIWAVNLDRLATMEREQGDAQPPMTIDRQEILEFAEIHYQKNTSGKGRWNGRQIRNAFLIASALARHEKTRGTRKQRSSYDLNADHFKTAVKAGTGFKRYLAARGSTDQEVAYRNGTRADHIQSPDEGRLPRTAAPTPAVPINPAMNLAWANQFPGQQQFTPLQGQHMHNVPQALHGNSSYPQQLSQPHLGPETGNPQVLFGQSPMTTGYLQSRSATPFNATQSHEQGWNMNSAVDDDWCI